ncbi:MAG: 50S ribosomal protein L11 methyltransferase [Clostridiales Family XIII bacterium]|jgi:ribosomal protein L11 methyltransferase|nr:50S ribosomal protein L11 methyltransferase [Clostridiales Family XIII bacterium]
MDENKTYKATKIYTTTAGAEAVSAMLLGFGVDGVSIEDKADIEQILAGGAGVIWDHVEPALLDDPGLPGEAVVTYYTPDNAEGDALIAAVKEGLMKLKAGEQYGDYGTGADFGRLYSETAAIGDEWKTKWKDSFKPFRVTDKFVICPPWETDHPYEAGGTETIIIDPGMAFGTGSHETTGMCAEALEKAVDASTVMLDLGTGSGILAIMAAKRGARTVIAIDIDEDALRSAAENIGRNGVAKTVQLIKGDITVETVRDLLVSANGNVGFDVICANLTSGILKLLLPASANLLSGDGKMILSGMLETERGDMLEAVAACGMKVYAEETRGEWLLLCAGF